jgi:hypothetical protein
MENDSKVYPIILMGVDRKEGLGFNRLKVVHEQGQGKKEEIFEGVISVQMVNDLLIIYVKEQDSK